MLFVGRDIQKFAKKPESLSGGTLEFEAYLFWAPRIIPNVCARILNGCFL
jgi:hypothetical protein